MRVGLSLSLTRFLICILMKYLIQLILLLVPISIYSQSAMLFPEYQKGTILLKGNQKVNVLVNYDATKHLMMYKQSDDDMILTNVQSVDSVMIGKHRFIPVKNRFYEVIPVKSEFLLVDWNIAMTEIGYRGAYGQVTHSKVHKYNVSAMTHDIYHTEARQNESLEVYRRSNRNTYYIMRNGKMMKFKDKKSLLKLFPDRKDEIEKFLKEDKTMFKNVEDVVELMEKIL